MHLTAQQQIARVHPCLLSLETMNPMFAKRVGAWSEILTVNTGYE